MEGKTRKPPREEAFSKATPSQEALHSEMFWTRVSTLERPESKETTKAASFYLKHFRQGNSFHRPTPKPKSTEVKKVISRTLHQLDESQKQALRYFKHLGETLQEDFLQDELASSFRNQALIQHPDHGGTTEQFIELHGHYKQLKRLFK